MRAPRKSKPDRAPQDASPPPDGTPGWIDAVGEACDGAALVTEGDAVVAISARYGALWGCARPAPPVPADALFAQLAATTIHPEHLLREVARPLASQAATVAGEISLLDGRCLSFRRSVLPPDEAGALGALWVFRDVSHERDVQRALRTARDRVRLFATHVRGLLLEFDADGRYLNVWTNEPSLLFRPEAELVGHTLVEVMGEAQARPFLERIAHVLRTGQPEQFEYELDVQSGRGVFATEAILVPPDDKEGKPPTVAFLVRDVTAQRRMEAQLRQAQRLASIGLLAAGVAHEVNNPLGYLMLNLERAARQIGALASRETSDAVADLRSALAIALEGADRVKQIVQDLTTFSRAEADRRSAIDLRDVLDLACVTTQKQIEAHAHVLRDYHDVPLIEAHEGRLAQVFVHLLLNAVQAMPEGRASEHQVRLVTRTDEAGRAIAEVHDTGSGMPPAIAEQIFDPFFTTKPAGQGTGLGLSVCYGIVSAMGGEITVESTPGAGTVVRVALPPHARTSSPG